MRKAKSILDEWKDSPVLEEDEKTNNSQKQEKLSKQKQQLASVLKVLITESEQKLDEYYQTDESLSDDEFLNPDKPFLATAVIYSVLSNHPEFSGAGGGQESDSEDVEGGETSGETEESSGEEE
jgi:hypothetical protein